MKCAVSALLLVTLGATSAAGATPIGKVLQLLSDLQLKITADGAKAQELYEEFSEFCEHRSKELAFQIKTGRAEAAGLEATIAKETSSTGALNMKIEDLAASVATDEADLKAATTIRAKEASTYSAQAQELTEAVDALERALAILKREIRKGGASMVQLKSAASVAQALDVLVQATALSSADGATLTALVQSSQQAGDSDDEAELGAPAAAVYEGHSGDIIGTLESLLEKASTQLSKARKTETTEIQSFQMLKQSLEDSITFATKDMDAAKKALAGSGEEKATAEGALAVTKKDLKTDTGALADIHQQCTEKAQDFEASTKSRDEELKALTEAKRVISQETGGAEQLAYGAASFLQLSSGADLAHFEAVRLVRDLARKQHSATLAQLASRMAAAARAGTAAGQDPFAKVKGLLADMIGRLEDEAASEASHKAYCDKEISLTSAKKAEKSAEIDKLSAKIDKMSTHSAQLKEEVAGLQKGLADLAASQAEMDNLRRAEKAAYAKGKADMEQGLEGVKLGLKILREYYAQEDKAHSAAEGAGASIIGLLEVVESDLSKGLAEMTASEDNAQSAYVSETKENEVERTMREQDATYKSRAAAQLDSATAEATSDRSGVQAELDATLESLASLSKQCTRVAETYGERKARREAELAGLKEALSILEGEAVLLQQRERRTLRGARPHRVAA